MSKFRAVVGESEREREGVKTRERKVRKGERGRCGKGKSESIREK